MTTAGRDDDTLRSDDNVVGRFFSLFSSLLICVATLCTTSCQLADDPDPPKCEKGFHIDLERCQPDKVSTIQVKISAAVGGTSCTGDATSQRPPSIDPETVHVAVGELFQFDNTDVVPHEIRGVSDGKVWMTVPAGTRSPLTSLAKAGDWGYRVSGCAKGGSVAVE